MEPFRAVVLPQQDVKTVTWPGITIKDIRTRTNFS